jgi:predicted membrane-bound spermidine synthase
MRVSAAALLATVFVTGACVLVIEIIGTRVLAPFFGSGIYTWSTLISVTLAALALGYWLGGRLADRRPDSRILYALCLLAGCWTALTPVFGRLLLPVLLPLAEMRFAVLVSGLVLFFPSLFLLGTIGPFAIRLITLNAAVVGTSSGRVFAVSTVGSLLAALAAGFILIPIFGTQAIFSGTGAVLALLGLSGLRDARWLAASVPLIAGTVSAALWLGAEDRAMARVEVIERLPSFYGELHVISKGDQLALLADGIGQNYQQRGGRWTMPYVAFLGAVPAMLGMPADGSHAALVIGLGAGQLPMLLEDSGLRASAVEIDPQVGLLARRHFGFELAADRVHYMDGRQFLARAGGRYDYIVLDAFTGEQIAWHLTSREALRQARDRLNPGGVLALNVASAMGADDVAALQRTLRDVFTHVRGFVDPQGGELLSFEFLASMEPMELEASSPALAGVSGADLRSFLGNELPDLGGTLVLTDDYNPINELRRPVHQLWRESMHAWMGRDSLRVLL